MVVFKSDGTPMAQHRWRRKSLLSLSSGADKVCSQAMVDELLRQYRETGKVAVARKKKKDRRRKEFKPIAKANGTGPRGNSSTPSAFPAHVAHMIPNTKERAMPVPGKKSHFAYGVHMRNQIKPTDEEMQFWQDLINYHLKKGRQSEENAKTANKILTEKLPKVAGKPMNMYLLFKHVISMGGMQNVTANPGKSSVVVVLLLYVVLLQWYRSKNWCSDKVNRFQFSFTPSGFNKGTWTDIFRLLPNYSPTETSASYRLRKIYEQYLLEYEQEYYSHLGSGLSAVVSHNNPLRIKFSRRSGKFD